MSKFTKQKQGKGRLSTIPDGLTGFGVAIAFPIFALVFVYFPSYLNAERSYEDWPAWITQGFSIVFYILSIVCLVVALGGFAIELYDSPKMRAYLASEFKNVFAKPLRSLRRKPTNREGLENASIIVLFFGLALVTHLVTFVILNVPDVLEILVKVLLILPLLLIGSLAIAASIDSVAVKPILLNREKRRASDIEAINWSKSAKQAIKVFLFFASLASAIVTVAELISRFQS